MLIDDLYHNALIAPATESGMERLQIVSGFATANMADRHMEHLAKLGKPVQIDLIIGMTHRSGIEKAQHYALQNLVESSPYGMDFSCRYVVQGTPVHAKTYCWFKGKDPAIGFSGSANYTRTGFGKSQIETITSADAQIVAEFQAKIQKSTDDCLASDIENKIALIETKTIKGGKIKTIDGDATDGNGSDTVTLSFLVAKTGKTPPRSGINWGQRPGRDPNQAYINIPAHIGGGDFFPPRFVPFTVLTDDDKTFIMVRAQDGGKGLETTQNNAWLGKYLRDRMGVPSGEYVNREDLEAYGRTDVTFTKIDGETYLMDFGPTSGLGEDSEKWQV